MNFMMLPKVVSLGSFILISWLHTPPDFLITVTSSSSGTELSAVDDPLPFIIFIMFQFGTNMVKKSDTCGIWTHAPYGINLAG